jgi:thiol-disulfide isomerase/thioredoxin
MIVYWALVGLIAQFFVEFCNEYHTVLFYSTLILSFSLYLILVFYFYLKSAKKSFTILSLISFPFLISLLLMQFVQINLSRLVDVVFLLLGILLIYIIVRKQEKRVRQLVVLAGYCLMLIPIYPIVYTNVNYAVMKNKSLSNQELGEFDISIADRKGQRFKLSNFKGKTICVDMWASSCGNCITSMPKFESLNKEFKKNKDYKIISLYCPIKKEQTYEWFKEYIDKKFPYDIDYYYIDFESFRKLNIWKFPEFLIIDKNSNLVYRGQIAYEPYIHDNIYNKLKSINENN